MKLFTKITPKVKFKFILERDSIDKKSKVFGFSYRDTDGGLQVGQIDGLTGCKIIGIEKVV